MIPLELESAWPRVRVKVGAKLKAERQKIWMMLTSVNSPNQILVKTLGNFLSLAILQDSSYHYTQKKRHKLSQPTNIVGNTMH